MNNTQIPHNNLNDLDVNNPAFKNNVQQEISNELSQLKKNIRVVEDLRMTAAEMEVEAAALYHAELWKNIEDLKATAEKNFVQ